MSLFFSLIFFRPLRSRGKSLIHFRAKRAAAKLARLPRLSIRTRMLFFFFFFFLLRTVGHSYPAGTRWTLSSVWMELPGLPMKRFFDGKGRVETGRAPIFFPPFPQRQTRGRRVGLFTYIYYPGAAGHGAHLVFPFFPLPLSDG